MLFKRETLEGIAAGRITRAFRRWKRPTVKAGGRLRTAVGELAIHAVDPIHEKAITAAEARKAGFADKAALLAFLEKQRPGTLYRIAFKLDGADTRIALREDARLSAADVSELDKQLERMDRASRDGPWTAKALRVIAQNPATRAGDLAPKAGLEKEDLKVRVRRLKNLGLTESLGTGYRLSPRGAAYLKKSKRHES